MIDEIQIRPELFALLRALTDQKREPARFILLGSASPHIVKLNTEPLAGRIAYHELAPFSYSEIKNLYTQETHWIKGGFPGALIANISKGFYKSVQDLQPDFKYVITPSGKRCDRDDGLRICPLAIFLNDELRALDRPA